jgi:hypothetical protein
MRQDNIRLLMRHLPAGYEAASRETGAMRRSGKVISSPSDLMWLALTHLSQGLTLVNMSALSKASGLGELSDVAFMKRLINCEQWFKWILQRLSSSSVADYLRPKGFENYRMLAVDASVVNSGVSKFSKSWRLHFALDVLTLASHEFKITEGKTGEALAHFAASKGDLFLADRTYPTKNGISHCLLNGADFIMRIRYDAFAVCDEEGEKIDLLREIKKAKVNQAVDIPVIVDLTKHGMGMQKLRICALRKSREAIEKTMKKMDWDCRRKEREVSPEARRFNECIVAITSLPDSIGADDVIAAYRYRWQVELYFKRLKSLLETGEVPKKRSECMETWLNGKMILAVLYEVLLSKLDFSPLGQEGEE